MDKNKAIEKIKKCLALGKSANEHEAAQALKQAQALMREYGISDKGGGYRPLFGQSARQKRPAAPCHGRGQTTDDRGGRMK